MTNIVEYDLSFWIKQNADETNAQKVCDEIVKKLQEKGFNIISVTVPSLRTVGQMIGKETQAYLTTVIFGLGTGDLSLIKDLFTFNNDVLRFMFTRKEIRPEKPRSKRTRMGFKKNDYDEQTEKEKIEPIAKTACDSVIPLTPEEKIKEIKEQIISENILEIENNVEEIKEEIINEKVDEEVVTEGPTMTEGKEIDLNELDKKLDELLK